MQTQVRTAQEAGGKELDATGKAVAVWVNQLARTLKTCRLYDARNPTAVKFRSELALASSHLFDEHGAVTLKFTDNDLIFDEQVVHSARSRDDNLALIFHRDGVRGLTFTPGIQQAEVDALVDAILQVSGQNAAQDDLVTLLWEAHLTHIEVDYVPEGGEIGSGEGRVGEAGPGEEGATIPWPSGIPLPGEESADEEPESATATPAPEPAESASAPEAPRTRSDDWTTGELTAEIDAGYAGIDALAATETLRFQAEFEAEHAVSATTTALAILRASLGADANTQDRTELLEFTPRLLRLAVGRGAWLEAVEALTLLRDADPNLLAGLMQETLQPISIATMVEHLDQQESSTVHDFIAFARSLGEGGIDLLNASLAESQQRRNRRLLAESIAQLCRENPERLAPWLADRRWFVVRNMVHILGWIGGDSIVGLLEGVLDHSEPRVRYEVVAALGQVTPALARPVLLRLLRSAADTRMFCAVMHQLSVERDPSTARKVMEMMMDARFEERAPEEKRAIYSALSSLAGDEAVPDLEAELIKGNWFARGQEEHRQSIARVLARIGTPAAQTVLQRGVLSKRPPVRKACQDALGGGTAVHG